MKARGFETGIDIRHPLNCFSVYTVEDPVANLHAAVLVAVLHPEHGHSRSLATPDSYPDRQPNRRAVCILPDLDLEGLSLTQLDPVPKDAYATYYFTLD